MTPCNRLALFSLALGSVLGMAAPALAQSGSGDPQAFVQRFDRSGKGLLDVKAVMNAAAVKFASLDTEKRGRLTEQQLGGLLTAEEFRIANPDGDTTIGITEWLDLARRRFEAANPDNDGSLSADELRTPAGQALLKLVQ